MQHYYLLLLLMTIKELEQYFITEILALYDPEESRQLFNLSAAHFSGFSRSQLLLQKDHVLRTEEVEQYADAIAQLKKGRPVQHIFGEAWFYGLRFKVNDAVLIPRPETEELVDWILNGVSNRKTPVYNVLDIGTGSGCIAISIKKALAELEVTALDVSEEALTVARENAEASGTEIEFVHADVLDYQTPVKYDLIVSNPPYITKNEGEEMHDNVLSYEPHLALFVSNENPLIFYKAIAELALNQLQPEGQLFFEINEYLGEEMVVMLKSKGFNHISLRKDMQGKDRMICCSR